MPNRTICSVLGAMRDCFKTRNFSYMEGLIEEAQMLANRMEAALWDQSDIEYNRDTLKNLKKEIKKLENKKQRLEK